MELHAVPPPPIDLSARRFPEKMRRASQKSYKDPGRRDKS
jgi:hypothetical protein